MHSVPFLSEAREKGDGIHFNPFPPSEVRADAFLQEPRCGVSALGGGKAAEGPPVAGFYSLGLLLARSAAALCKRVVGKGGPHGSPRSLGCFVGFVLNCKR